MFPVGFHFFCSLFPPRSGTIPVRPSGFRTIRAALIAFSVFHARFVRLSSFPRPDNRSSVALAAGVTAFGHESEVLTDTQPLDRSPYHTDTELLTRLYPTFF